MREDGDGENKKDAGEEQEGELEMQKKPELPKGSRSLKDWSQNIRSS